MGNGSKIAPAMARSILIDKRSMPVEISVVVPLYNKKDHILRCLQSICNQTFTEFEAIIVDDGSTDGSADLAEQFPDGRFRVIRQANGGPGAARNRGVRESKGELIAFLDADDEWRPGFLQAIRNLQQRFPQAGFFATGYRRTFGHDFDRELTLAGGQPMEVRNYLELATEGDFVTSSSVAVRRRLFQEAGYFPENEPLGEDVDLWVRIGICSSLAFDPAILAVYHSEASGGSFERCRTSPPYPPVVRTLRKALGENRVPAALHAAAQAYIDLRLIQYALRLLHLGNRPAMLEVLRAEPWRTPRIVFEAWMLRIGVMVLPLRVVYALRWKPLNLLNSVKRLIKGELAWMGERIIYRLVPVDGMETVR